MVAVTNDFTATYLATLNNHAVCCWLGVNTFTRESFLRVFLESCIKVTPRTQVQDCRDPKDDKFLSVALEAKAVMLVTGDKKDLLSMNPYKDVAIITAREFLSLPI